MLNSLRCAKNIYDLMALCCVYIEKTLESRTVLDDFEDDNYNNVYDAIDSYCIDREEYGREQAFEKLKKFVTNFFNHKVSVERCFAIVKYIDDLVEIEYPVRYVRIKDIEAYERLNSSFYDKVRIIPKNRNNFFSKHERILREQSGSEHDFFRKKREIFCSVIDEYMVNYAIWDESNLKKFPLKIYRMWENHYVTKHLQEISRLSFAILPLTNIEFDRCFEWQSQNKTFSIHKMKDDIEKQILEKYKFFLKEMSNKKIDFLIMPELMMSDYIINELISNEIAFANINVLGSVWKDDVNKTDIYSKEKEFLFSYCKKTPFILNGEWKERLNSEKNKEYSILEIPHFGRVGIVICKDLLDENVKMFHKYMGTNILLVPAYTESMDLQSAAGELARDYHCIVVVANSCSAIQEKRIGFISLPAKNVSDRAELISMYCKEQCNEGCEQKCDGRIVTIDFTRSSDYEGDVSYLLEWNTVQNMRER